MTEPHSPTILALDCAGPACSAALWRRGALAGHRFQPMARGHAEALMPMAMAVLAESGIGFGDLDLLAVTVGPGAFTGLRIGLAAARGLALATGLPVFGVTSFAAVAEAVPADERSGRSLLVLLDSKRGDVFVQRFDAALAPLGEPAVLPIEHLADWLPPGPHLAAGDGVPLARRALERRGPEIAYACAGAALDAAQVARIAARQAAAGRSPGLAPVPFYLRGPAVTAPGRGAPGGRDPGR